MHEGYFVALLITLTFFLHSWTLAPSLQKNNLVINQASAIFVSEIHDIHATAEIPL